MADHLAPMELKFSAEKGTVSGYASRFNAKDYGGDTVQPGAFTATLREHKARGSKPLFLWQHDQTAPIGIWTKVEEDDKGLFVEGKLITEASRGADAHALLKAGALSGLSIGYRVRKARPAGGRERGRLLDDLDLVEISLVSFPMLDTARVDSVKSQQITRADVKAHLMTMDGMTGRLARNLLATVDWSALSTETDDTKTRLADAIRRHTTEIEKFTKGKI